MSEKHEIQVRFLSLALEEECRLLTGNHFDHTRGKVDQELNSVIRIER
jgi:hypothetical protein